MANLRHCSASHGLRKAAAGASPRPAARTRDRGYHGPCEPYGGPRLHTAVNQKRLAEAAVAKVKT